MAIANIIHTQEILDELSRICDSELKAPLSLQAVIQGELAFQPAASIPTLVNGIWIHPLQITSEPDQIPKRLRQTYPFRFVYLKKIALNTNPLKGVLADVALIANTLTDHYHLPQIAGLPAHAQILWANVSLVDVQPAEDEYVARLAADIKAIAFNYNVQVLTRRP